MEFKIDKKDILQIASSADVYRRGVRYFEENRVKYMSYEKRDTEILINTTVDGNYKSYNIKIRFDKSGVLLSHSCNCQAHEIWKGACKHVVCAMLKVYENNLNYSKAAINNSKAFNIIEGFEEKTFSEIDKRLKALAKASGEVKLIPLIKTDGKGAAFLGLSIGIDKIYVIKDITELLENIKEEKFYSYGKELSLNHTIDIFDEKSRKLIEVIAPNKEKYSGGKYIPLISGLLDHIFDIYENDMIQSDIHGFFEKTLLLKSDTPSLDINISLNSHEKKAIIYPPEFNYHFLEGEKKSYILVEGGLFSLEKSLGKALNTLLSELSGQKEGISFEDKAFFGFMKYIYPFFKGPDEESILLPELYFDMPLGDISVKIKYPSDDYENDHYKDPAKYEIEKYLELWGFHKKSEEDNEYILKGDDKIYDFLSSSFSGIKENAAIFVTDDYRKKDINAGVKLSAGIRLEGELLNIFVDTGEYSFNELLNAIQAIDIKKKFFRFKNGSFIDFRNKEINTFKELSEELNLKGDKKSISLTSPKYRAMFLDGMLSEGNISLNKDSSFQNFIDKFKKSREVEFEIPEFLKNTLRQYQKTGYKWLKSLSSLGLSGILADEMGLGKTIQIIALLLSEKEDFKNPSIVVSPTSLIYNWQKEISRFAPELNAVVLSGTAKERQEIFASSEKAHVFIITYDTLKRDINHLKNIEFNYIILDEAQYIKNPLTKAAGAVKSLKSRRRFALTGTPIENSLSELWSIFDFLMPGYLHSYSKFQKLYERPIVLDNNADALKSLRNHTAPFILRRTKEQVLKDLPDKVYSILYAELTKEQKKLYTANFLKAKGEFDAYLSEESLSKNKFRVLSMLTRLRQICCHPAMFVENYIGGSGKLDITLETIKNLVDGKHRILLFSQFTSMLDIIKKGLEAMNISYYYLDGGTPSKERALLTEEFNKGGASVFLISLRAGGSGLNLTGADIIIHFDQWWNPAVMEQASDRAHRIGQKKTVHVYNIIAKDTIEEKIIELQNKKRDLTQNIIQDGETFINLMAEDELRKLFMSSDR